jgi:TRAP-type mannitol/chloroaromatic compound transport system permease small subunit
MPRAIRAYVRWVDAINRRIGRSVMYLIFFMMGVLIYSTVARIFFGVSPIWVVEVAQMTMAAYYLLGGGYSMQLDAHVRMDLLYGRWSPRRQAFSDTLTAVFLVFYLVVLLYGGISSAQYAIEYDQRNYSAWAPLMWPIKVVMAAGIFLTLLQAIAIFFKDLARVRGKSLS